MAALLLCPQLRAKEIPASAIALFDGPSGPAYVQISGLTLNAKTELRICDGVTTLNKGAYENLPRTQLAGAAFLERTLDGALALNVNSKSICVVPSNLKFEKNAELTLSDAADQAVLQGTVVSSSSTQAANIPEFKRGVRLVLVAAPDDELAQFLLAQRVNSIAGWQGFLARNASSGHAADARNSLASIHQESADAAFSKYQKSASGGSPDIGALKQSAQQSDEAIKAVPGYPAAAKLKGRINKELDALLEADRPRLQAFRKALADGAPGYSQLESAKQHIADILPVNPEYAPVLNLKADVDREINNLESTVQKAEALVASKDYDQALSSLGPYGAFAGEVARIAAVVTAAYSVHFQRGRALAASHDWEPAVSEFRRASEIEKNSQASSELKDAESQWAMARDRQAAQDALAKSQQYAQNQDFIEAYEVLAELPEAQRAMVTAQLATLQKDFVPLAVHRAQKLQEIHLPIHGRADEDAVQEAFELLSRAGGISGDPAIRLKLDLLSEKISSYYLDQAKHYLSKPLASGVGVGWLYLGQADHYKPNLSTVKDAMAEYAPAYQLRSKLSVGVVLRDQTSRRNSIGFADQLADSIASGLESSGLSVKVVRQPKEGDNAVQPNFVLIGEIREHRVVKDSNLETLQSKYRAGTHDVKNEDWTKANDAYQSAQQALQAAQRSLADAHAKKDIAAANDAVAAAQKAVDDARHKLDSTEPTKVQAVIEPYNYTKKNIDLTATINLAFHVSDGAGNLIDPGTEVKADNHQRFSVLENVKPEDSEGVKIQGSEPDDVRFLTDLEIQARDSLVKAVRERVMTLPVKILQQARDYAQQKDVDGAAEQYIVYLNATTDSPSPERAEATHFLREHYNLEVNGTGTSAGGAQVRAGIN